MIYLKWNTVYLNVVKVTVLFRGKSETIKRQQSTVMFHTCHGNFFKRLKTSNLKKRYLITKQKEIFQEHYYV